MEQWEYFTTFLEANAKDKDVQQFIEQTFDKKPKRHSPEAMIPDLNKLGIQGWELIHMEPVPRVGGKEDVQFDSNSWSSVYFCVFKRRKSAAAAAQVNPVQQTQP
jgi:hypothetical protein